MSAFPLVSAFFLVPALFRERGDPLAIMLTIEAELGEISSLRFCGIIENDIEYIRTSRDAKSGPDDWR